MPRPRTRALVADATWLLAGALRRGRAADLFDWLRAQAAVEWEYGRAVLWLAPAFGGGILLYGLAAHTPALWAGPVAALATIPLAILGRGHLKSLIGLSAAAAVALGFSAATLEEWRAAGAPRLSGVLRAPLSGTVESVQPRQRDLRVILSVHRLGSLPARQRPTRVRVSLPKKTVIQPGDRLTVTATWRPPPGPIRPGGYDAARVAFVQGIGAFGSAPADIKVRASAEIGIAARIERLRLDLAHRIEAAAGGGVAGPIAAALVTGIRSAIPAEAEDDLRDAGLSHLLSISGTHLALVAGVLFFGTRALLAMSQHLALTRPIKTWSALAALGGISFYLLLSGAEVATQRSYVMSAIVLVAIAAGRPALTMRNVALAAIAVLAVSPSSLFGPSLQMSFAAVIAIVAGFEGMNLSQAGRAAVTGEGRLAAAGGWALRFLLFGLATTLLAGLATAPFAAFHFHRLTPYSLLGNLAALPLVSFWIMPAAVLGALLVPFGLDDFAWRIMGAGIEAMLAAAHHIAELPGAERFVPAFGGGATLWFTASLLVAALFVSWLRLAAIPLAMLAFALAAAAERPDVLIDPSGRAIAVRGADGRLAIIGARPSSLAGRSWLEADGENPKGYRNAPARCDELGCTGTLPDGRVVALVRDIAAFGEDCRRAALIVTQLRAPEGCARNVAVVDRAMLKITGSLGLFADGAGFSYDAARPATGERAWYGRDSASRATAADLPDRLAPAPAAAAIDGDDGASDDGITDSEDAAPLTGSPNSPADDFE